MCCRRRELSIVENRVVGAMLKELNVRGYMGIFQYEKEHVNKKERRSVTYIRWLHIHRSNIVESSLGHACSRLRPIGQDSLKMHSALGSTVTSRFNAAGIIVLGDHGDDPRQVAR